MRKDRLVKLLSVLCVIAVSVMAAVLFRGGRVQKFSPPPFEPAAQSGMPEEPACRELDAQVFRVGLCGEVRIREDAAQVWFSNPGDNAVWLGLRILDEEGQILGQTGLLRPGEYVRQVAVTGAAPGTPVILKVMAYEPDTYHSAGSLTVHTYIAEE